MRLHRQEFRTI